MDAIVDDTYLDLFDRMSLQVGRDEQEVQQLIIFNLLQIYFSDLALNIDLLATSLEIQPNAISSSLENYQKQNEDPLSYESFFAIIDFVIDSQISKEVAGEFFNQVSDQSPINEAYNDDLLDYLQNQEDEDDEVGQIINDQSESLVKEQIIKQKLDNLSSLPASNHNQIPMKKTGFTQSTVPIEEKRKITIREVYEFYCKQTYIQGKYATFDRLRQESTIMTLGKFMYFCRDFELIDYDSQNDEKVQQLLEVEKSKIPIKKNLEVNESPVNHQVKFNDDPQQEQKQDPKKEISLKDNKKQKKKGLNYRKSKLITKFVLVEIFKKCSSNNKDINLEEFNLSLSRIGEFIFLKRLVLLNDFKKVKSVPEEELKQLKSISFELVNQLLELHDIAKCRKKMKMVQKAFNMKEDFERVKADDLKYKFQLYNPNESNQEILKAELERRKEEKEKFRLLEKEKRDFFKLQQLLKFHSVLQLEEMFPEKREILNKILKIRTAEREKLKQRVRSKASSVPQKQSEVQQKISYEVLKQDMKPLQLLKEIVSQDAEDDIYLAEYQLDRIELAGGQGSQGIQKIPEQLSSNAKVNANFNTNGSYNQIHRKVTQRSQSIKNDDKRREQWENYGKESQDISEGIMKSRSISQHQPPQQLNVSHGGQGSYASNVKKYQDLPQQNPQVDNSYLYAQNQNHLKPLKLQISPKKQAIAISSNTLARAKELELEELRKERQIQLYIDKNNHAKLQLKRSGYY